MQRLDEIEVFEKFDTFHFTIKNYNFRFMIRDLSRVALRLSVNDVCRLFCDTDTPTRLIKSFVITLTAVLEQ